MRPAGPLPRTVFKSMPSLRASIRTDGDAFTVAATSAGSGSPSGGWPLATASGGPLVGCGSCPSGRATATGGGGAISSGTVPAGVYDRIKSPTLSVAPGWTRRSVTVPANGAGTSMVALSVMTSISPCPCRTASPAATSQRIISAS
jgi:hypothetical protein